VATHFFQRRNTVRKLYSVLKLFNLGLLVLIYLINLQYYDVNSESDLKDMQEEKTGIVRLIIQCVIWIPYMIYSERARGTFTEAPEVLPSADEPDDKTNGENDQALPETFPKDL
jgi:hypothetical protein